jgi:hypothetical protein
MDTPEQAKGGKLDHESGGKATTGILKNAARTGMSTGSLAKPRSTHQSSAGRATATGGRSIGRRGAGGVELGDGDLSAARPRFGADLGGGRTVSRSKSSKPMSRSPSPPIMYNDPRQQIYEAKYEKYLANKKAHQEHDVKRKSI